MTELKKSVGTPGLQLVLAELRKLRAELRTSQKRLLTVEETGRYLGISPKTIRNGLGPKTPKPFPVKPVKLAGRVLFKKEDLDRFIDQTAGGQP